MSPELCSLSEANLFELVMFALLTSGLAAMRALRWRHHGLAPLSLPWA